MNLTLMPKTMPGKISITFIIISIALVLSVILIAMSLGSESIAGGFFSNMPLVLMALGAFAGAVISFITGFVAAYKQKDRSILLFICLTICIFFIYFGIAQFIGEIAGAH